MPTYIVNATLIVEADHLLNADRTFKQAINVGQVMSGAVTKAEVVKIAPLPEPLGDCEDCLYGARDPDCGVCSACDQTTKPWSMWRPKA